ncbi:MAG: type VI secretion system baseplate subunit TssE [Ignavibacteriaceae bacterium]|nr:type VI secretion system baseplate subunit TssE [Ignavibacterium sp.]MCC6255166.1 type VI secretion system baseplate subunit TssE [Ignavibacteriaceae bacterium]HRN25166.1 type VI secretion system baseplate subunit TssE [Ignavibacteriaceae bacterium]HRP92296.1 type VI secretion system baseplate subunit TssE [Ignavibacteriaceae bacterium]HRQ53354.1 type VI secretion system baseplate subunit TssE [Ignavibacteriaceae bacterium]
MKNLSLYNILLGQFISEVLNPDEIGPQQFEQLTEDQKLSLSIIENLRMILTTRRGSILHLPDFGISDILQIYLSSENPVESLKQEIKDVILKYEPRISEVRMENSEFDQKTLRAALKIIIKVKDSSNQEILLTEFSTTGWTKVVYDRDDK